jgi:outer membrane beta-barrel protein
MKQPWHLRALGCALLTTLLLSSIFVESYAYGQDDPNERFKNVEIRVIRPRYFSKRKRFELGAQFNSIMNESFIYTFMANGLATYHFNESFALELAAGFGLNLNKEEKRVLFDEFAIKTRIFRTLYTFEGSLQWTPIYGKWQLSSGRLIYFDTYLTAGGGMTGIDWKYSDFCTESDSPEAAAIPADTVKSYPTFLIGLGQRYFVSKKSALKWDIRSRHMMYEEADTACDPTTAASGSSLHNTITLQFGASRFF